MTDKLSEVVQKMPYGVYSSRHVPGWVTERRYTHTCMPLRKSETEEALEFLLAAGIKSGAAHHPARYPESHPSIL